MTSRIPEHTWWVTIEDCCGEEVAAFGMGLPDLPVSLELIRDIAANNIPCPHGRAIIRSLVAEVTWDSIIAAADADQTAAAASD